MRRLAPGLCAALALATAAPTSAQLTYNVNLLQNINVYPSVQDCWGYRSPGGVELAIYAHSTGTSFVDATDPANAVEVVNIPGATSGWHDIKTYLNYAYIVTEGSGPGTGLQIVDLADPMNPVLVTTYTGNGFTTAHNLWIDEPAGIAYACGASGAGMHVLSLANPTAPVQL
ncbi:MAG: hypothetical protein HKN12_01630, partial [Gemmatimonadetes bacterium]|nr:hypothetical protein [Gemmatimonadota bacterium]